MAKTGKDSSAGPTIRRLFVSDVDVAAARRLLTAVAQAEEAAPSGAQAAGVAAGSAIEQARLALAFRERRIRTLGGVFAAEPAFALLLALYATEAWEPTMTITRLSQLSLLTSGTTDRWLEQLVGDGWIERRKDGVDGRKTLLSLSAEAREALEKLFSERL